MTPQELHDAEGILLTDQYQLTMAQLYFRAGLHERPAQFDHFFRSYPDYGAHQAGYAIAAGLQDLLGWMAEVRFRPPEIEHLRAMRGSTGEPLFDDDFLDWLSGRGFEELCVEAVPEGRVVHPHAPMTVVTGPLAMAQILETALLNHLNYATLIATKAARVRTAGRGRPVLEFGLRRAQSRGATVGGRAALIGGADFSSNVGLSRAVGLPAQGTHAHSMVQAFIALGEGELGAFRAYARAFPDDTLLLVDTIDTMGSGVPNAIRVFEELREAGHEPVGIRLDSGDLSYLAVQSAKALNEAGFPDTSIVLSSSLDELSLMQILSQIEEEAGREELDPQQVIDRLIYGVGTRLITSKGDAALDGVFKLVAVQDGEGTWQPAIKVSDSPAKIPNPGRKHVWRLYDHRGMAVVDLLTLDGDDPAEREWLELRHPSDHARRRRLPGTAFARSERLLTLAWRDGAATEAPQPLEALRQRREQDLERLDPGVKRIVLPHAYHVSLDGGLWDQKRELIRTLSGTSQEA